MKYILKLKNIKIKNYWKYLRISIILIIIACSETNNSSSAHLPSCDKQIFNTSYLTHKDPMSIYSIKYPAYYEKHLEFVNKYFVLSLIDTNNFSNTIVINIIDYSGDINKAYETYIAKINDNYSSMESGKDFAYTGDRWILFTDKYNNLLMNNLLVLINTKNKLILINCSSVNFKKAICNCKSIITTINLNIKPLDLS